jgi:type IV secretory pathway VirB2 component (pilin)
MTWILLGLSWMFGLTYLCCCIGCFVGGVTILFKGKTITEKTVGALAIALGTVGLVLLF